MGRRTPPPAAQVVGEAICSSALPLAGRGILRRITGAFTGRRDWLPAIGGVFAGAVLAVPLAMGLVMYAAWPPVWLRAGP